MMDEYEGIEHVTALAHQARAIRLAAQRLERLARERVSNGNPCFQGYDVIQLRRGLGDISHNVTALTARFGKADR